MNSSTVVMQASSIMASPFYTCSQAITKANITPRVARPRRNIATRNMTHLLIRTASQSGGAAVTFCDVERRTPLWQDAPHREPSGRPPLKANGVP